MASGRQKSDENVIAFEQWVASMLPTDFQTLVFRGKLNRVEVAKAVGCAKSALQQNPRLKQQLFELEEKLRERGILPPPADTATSDQSSCPNSPSSDKDKLVRSATLHRMEQRILALEAENRALKQQLSRFSELSEVLTEMGRLPE